MKKPLRRYFVNVTCRRVRVEHTITDDPLDLELRGFEDAPASRLRRVLDDRDRQIVVTPLSYAVFPGTLLNMVATGGQEGLLAQMRRGTLEYCVLALVEAEERYGFDLVRALGAQDGMVTSEGTIYPLLSRLRREGLVESTWQESPSGPPRRYYRLTEAGRSALDGFRLEWARFRDAVDHFVGRMPK